VALFWSFRAAKLIVGGDNPHYDLKRASVMFERAYQNGQEEAAMRLGVLYQFNPVELETDMKLAIHWYTRGCLTSTLSLCHLAWYIDTRHLCSIM
jgi:TPR repeat protein